jgi:hypothetical protein
MTSSGLAPRVIDWGKITTSRSRVTSSRSPAVSAGRTAPLKATASRASQCRRPSVVRRRQNDAGATRGRVGAQLRRYGAADVRIARHPRPLAGRLYVWSSEHAAITPSAA